MATITQAAKHFVGSFDEAAGRIRVINELLIDTVKATGTAFLDAYEQGVTDLINFQQQVAGVTQPGWVNSVVKAQTEFYGEISAAYTAVAREALK
jgi:hypothetical protein